jgi:hypothetical protein
LAAGELPLTWAQARDRESAGKGRGACRPEFSELEYVAGPPHGPLVIHIVHKNVYKTRIRKLWNTVFIVAQTPRLWQARNPTPPLTLLNLMF